MNRTATKLRHILYALSFFFSIHLAITAYVNSSFIERIVSATQVGILYTIASVLGIAVIFYLPQVLQKRGATMTAMWAIILHMVAIYGLIVPENLAVIICSFVLYLITNSAIIYFLDIFLETETNVKEVGKTRGMYLTIMNLAWVASPLFAGAILTMSGYKMLYFIGFLAMIPVFLLIIFLMRKFKDPVYKTFSLKKVLVECYERRDIGRIWIANFTLQFFYVWMVIYTPIYLHEVMKIAWSDIGIIFTIMLLPFVIIQYPLGRIADKWLGEKELLVAGFAVMGVSTYVMSTINSTSIIVWGSILFLTRVGASIVEIMTETYFFKQITPKDSDLISFFRNASPFAYITAPLIATLLLLVLPIHLLFVVLAGVILIGFAASTRIKDTL